MSFRWALCCVDDLVHLQIDISSCVVLLALTVALPVTACGPKAMGAVTDVPGGVSPSTTTGENPQMKTGVPKGILDPILNEAAKLAKVPKEQLVIVRAEAVVWNDGSLGCPEPGMQYTQALTNGYWVVISATGQTYDFRVARDGNFRLCPEGRGHPPLPSNTQRDSM